MSSDHIITEVEKGTNKVLWRYQRGPLLGKGGFAKCYQVSQLETGRVLAAKIIDKSTLTKPKTIAKLKSEIKIHSSLNHRHVVKFERYFEDVNCVYIILELCAHQSLMELQRRKKRFNEQEARFLMMQIIQSVKYMHSKLVIHRDLKLGNLFLDENFNIKVGDFGLAAQLQYDGERKTTVCGTPNYIAPEILDPGKHGHSFEVDIWSLGVILFTLIVGKPPFETSDIKTTYRKIRNLSYSFPDNMSISTEAKDLIVRILQSVPEQRPTLEDLENDPFFTKYEVPRVAPLSMYPEGHAPRLATTAAAAVPSPRHAVPPPAPATTHPTIPRSYTPSSEALQRAVNSVPATALTPRSSQLNFNGNVLTSPRTGHIAATVTNAGKEGPNSARSTPVTTTIAGLRSTHTVPNTNNPYMSPRTQPIADPLPSGRIPSTLPHTLTPKSSTNTNAYASSSPRNTHYLPATASSTVPSTPYPAPTYTTTATPTSIATESTQSVWVTEYSDFSARYGLTYLMSNGTVGAYYNDATKMIWNPAIDRVEYIQRNKEKKPEEASLRKDEVIVCSTESYPEHLHKKITLIKYFVGYFKKYRGRSDAPHPIIQSTKSSSSVPLSARGGSVSPTAGNTMVYVRSWTKTDRAAVFRLSNKWFQSVFNDGVDLALSMDGRYVSHTNQLGVTRPLPPLDQQTDADTKERLEFVYSVLSQLMKNQT